MTDAEIVAELRKYAEAESGEVTDYLYQLCKLESFLTYQASNQFRDAYRAEIEHQLGYMRKHTRIEHTVEDRKINIVRLAWIDD